ncbi:Ktr system potassium uptake protein B [Pirellulimonas nuda]|uniref:Ktr system potassium uptake protein B n=1 Tax=Pirellulimonas nuda TaxID=2528009 RepID=A0A518DHC1_9BACT|nr:potassium transporter TrkG [Pirellulimonas nuda]QDU90842.1 Ktr system potassium uptake protein B [Pirellulimonas nuda]
MAKVTGPVAQYPARASLICYVGLIVVGWLALMVPACRVDSALPISVDDALFTATSAVCVTGLIVRDTATEFSFLGQLVILALIQVGGVGIMTVTTFIVIQFDRQSSLRQRALLAETIGAAEGKTTDLRRILARVLLFAALFEAVGALLLFAHATLWLRRPVLESAWHSIFHSVSAFCNAGFALETNSLEGYRGDWGVNLIIAVLIISGGLGFPVILDIQRNLKFGLRDGWNRLQLHSKLMLTGTGVLLVLGAVAILLLEWNNALVRMPWHERVLVSCFQSVTCRTAGFNTIPMGSLSNASLLVSMLLMMIGAGPCSTAGGFKVTTAAILLVRAWNTFRGYTRVNLWRRTLPDESIDRANATLMLFVAIAVTALIMLLSIESPDPEQFSTRNSFMQYSFEVISALGTVGLSTGITAFVSVPGRLVLIALMLLGRLGPISTFVALSHGERRNPVQFVNEEPLVG